MTLNIQKTEVTSGIFGVRGWDEPSAQQDLTTVQSTKVYKYKACKLREVFKKSKWKFKMAFAIRRPSPLNGKISRHFFTPLFFFCN